MVEEVDAACRGCYDCGVAKRRYLVAEVSSGYDGSGNPACVESHKSAYAHESDSNCGDCAPRAAGKNRNHAANNACDYKKKCRIENLQTVLDENRDDTAQHPCGADHGYTNKHGDGRKYLTGAA